MINVGTIAEEILRRAAPSPRKSSRVSPRPSFTSCDDATPSDGFEATLPEKRFASTIGLIELARIGKRTGVQMQGRRFIANTTKSGWHSLSLLLLGKIPLRIGPLASLRIAVRTVGGRSLLGLEQYGLRIPFGSEFTPIPIPAAWAESAGRYRMSNEMLLPPFEELTLSVDRGVLQITATARKAGRLGLVLEPLSDEASVVRGFGRAAGVEVYRSGNDGSQTLRMLGLEFRRM